MGKRLFIRNLSPDTTESELYDLFAGAGTVNLILLPDLGAGMSKNQCIVDMETVEMARAAVQKVNDHILHGRIMQVLETRRPDRRSSPT